MARTESQLQLRNTSGHLQTYTFLEYATPDDLVRVALKAYVFEKRAEVPYVSPFSREVRDLLVHTHVSVSSRG